MKTDFLKIISQNQNILHKVCHLYTDTNEDREDLFQEILIQIWKSIDQFQSKSKLSTWMYKIALHTAITHLNKSKRLLNHQYHVKELLSFQELPDRYQEEDYQRLNTAISQLNNIDKAITLLHLEKHSYQDISNMMGITESNVGVRINRIKKQLKTIMHIQNG
jgi:RNA polymerase sigma-70 factor (ECF subfamily)